MSTLKKTSSESLIPVEKRRTYELLQYFTMIAALIAYAIKFNFFHHDNSYNFVVLPMIFVLTVGPLLLKFTGNEHLTRPLICAVSPLVISIFVYATGGVDSPGLIWFAAIPVVFVILLGPNFLKHGLVVSIVFITGFAYLKSIDVYVPWMYSETALTISRYLDTVFFLICTAVNLHFYITAERSHLLKLHSENHDVKKQVDKFIVELKTSLNAAIHEPNHLPSIAPHLALDSTSRLENSIEQLNSTLQQVLHLNALSDDQKLFNFEKVCAKECIQETIHGLSSQIQKKKLKITTYFNDKPLDFYTDSDIVKDIVLKNILQNAVKYSYSGSSIFIKAWDDDSRVYIEVRDFGIGIPQSLQESLYHFSKTTLREGTYGEAGTGYGLPLAARYLNKLRGQIQITSYDEDQQDASRKGTRALVVLPK